MIRYRNPYRKLPNKEQVRVKAPPPRVASDCNKGLVSMAASVRGWQRGEDGDGGGGTGGVRLVEQWWLLWVLKRSSQERWKQNQAEEEAEPSGTE